MARQKEQHAGVGAAGQAARRWRGVRLTPSQHAQQRRHADLTPAVVHLQGKRAGGWQPGGRAEAEADCCLERQALSGRGAEPVEADAAVAAEAAISSKTSAHLNVRAEQVAWCAHARATGNLRVRW